MPAGANTITVTNTNDSGPGSLRQALGDANDFDVINFSVSGTIRLTSGQLAVNANIVIDGPGADMLAVNGRDRSRVFYISLGKTVTISGLTITQGKAGLVGDGFFGGGILNDHSTLTVSNCTLSRNSADSGGGGIFNDGRSGGRATLSITNSTLDGSQTRESIGGGILNTGRDRGRATLSITNSTLNGNQARSQGGGIYNDGEFDGTAMLTVSNSTISGNSARRGNAGVILNKQATLEIGDTILKAETSNTNILNDRGRITSFGYNLSSDNGGGVLTGPGDQINTDPMLGPLQDNGGPTFTHTLLSGSPAINAGDPDFTPPPEYDQRGPGFDRVVNGRIDIGAFEAQATPMPTSTPELSKTSPQTVLNNH